MISMEQDPSSESDSRSADQEIIAFVEPEGE
jgi:hypothetical protein